MTTPKPFEEIPLAPCPCCGAMPEAHFGDYGDWSRAYRSFVICCPKHKDFRTKPFSKYARAAEDWNHAIAGKPKGWKGDKE